MEVLTPLDYRSGQRKRPRRRDRPCDACRKRKTRCVTKNGEDSCVHCQLRRSTCTFQHDAPERASTSDPPTGVPAIPSSGPSTTPPGAPTARPRNASSVDRGQAAYLHVQQVEGASVGSAAAPATSVPGPAAASHGVSDATSSSALGSKSSMHDGFSLGMSHSRFAELYGLGSDMEPVLMVGSPSQLVLGIV